MTSAMGIALEKGVMLHFEADSLIDTYSLVVATQVSGN